MQQHQPYYNYGGGGSSSSISYHVISPSPYAAVSTISMVIFFGSVTFVTVGMATKTWLLGDMRAIRAATSTTKTANHIIHRPTPSPYPNNTNTNDTQIPPLDCTSFQSLYIFFYHLTLLGFVLGFVYIMDGGDSNSGDLSSSSSNSRTTSAAKNEAGDSLDQDTFQFLLSAVAVIACFTIRRNHSDGNNDDAGNHDDRNDRNGNKHVVDDDVENEDGIDSESSSSTVRRRQRRQEQQREGLPSWDEHDASTNGGGGGISRSILDDGLKGMGSVGDEGGGGGRGEDLSDDLRQLLGYDTKNSLSSSTTTESKNNRNDDNYNDDPNKYGDDEGEMDEVDIGKTDTTFHDVNNNNSNTDGGPRRRRTQTINTNLSPSTTTKSPSRLSTTEVSLEEILLEDETERLAHNQRIAQEEIRRTNELPPVDPRDDVLNYDQGLEWRGILIVAMVVCRAVFPPFDNGLVGGAIGGGEGGGKGGGEEGGTMTIITMDKYHNLASLFLSTSLFLYGFGHAISLFRTFPSSSSSSYPHPFSLFSSPSGILWQRVLIRSHLSVLFLCLTFENRSYLQSYPACAIHMYGFVVVWILVKWNEGSWNHRDFWIRSKLALGALVLFAIWDYFDFGSVLYYRSSSPAAVATTTPFHYNTGGGGRLYTLYSIVHLHHWCPFVALVFALNLPGTARMMEKLEAMGGSREWIGKGVMAIALVYGFSVWWRGCFVAERFIYDATNPYFAPFPILTFIYLRNLTPTLRRHHLHLFRMVGTISLELYLLHTHLLLPYTENSTQNDNLFWGYPSTSLLLRFTLLFFLAGLMRKITLVIVSMIIPSSSLLLSIPPTPPTPPHPSADYTYHNNENNVRYLAIGIGIAYALSFLLFFTRCVSSLAVGMTTAVCGIVSYGLVMYCTWFRYKKTAAVGAAAGVVAPPFSSFPSSAPPTSLWSFLIQEVGYSSNGGGEAMMVEHESPLVRMTPLAIGKMVIFLLGLAWETMGNGGTNSASAIRSLLPPVCSEVANFGSWIPINTCTSYQRSIAQRRYGVGAIYDCSITSSSSFPPSTLEEDGDTNNNDVTTIANNNNRMSDALGWAWKENPFSRKKCPFYHRSSSLVRKTLHQRYILFIGDSTVSHLFDALYRALGDTNTDDSNGNRSSGGDGGGGDGTMMASDRLERYGYDDGSSITLQYRYAPLPGDIASFLGEMRKRRSLDANNIRGADVIVAGCGMWDALHVSSSIDGGEEGASSTTKRAAEETYHRAVRNLANEFLHLQQPLQPPSQQDDVLQPSATTTIWMTPTTINTQALLNGGSMERRRYMDERSVEKTRTLYRDLGIYDAVGFVLDGKTLTKDLVHESWDGVSYHKVVYDAGIQIVLNALDWSLEQWEFFEGGGEVQGGKDGQNKKEEEDEVMVKANPLLGTMVLCVVLVGLVFHDGYLGVSFLPSLFVTTSGSRILQVGLAGGGGGLENNDDDTSLGLQEDRLFRNHAGSSNRGSSSSRAGRSKTSSLSLNRFSILPGDLYAEACYAIRQHTERRGWSHRATIATAGAHTSVGSMDNNSHNQALLQRRQHHQHQHHTGANSSTGSLDTINEFIL